MMQDKALALNYTQIGGLTSILPVAYGNALLTVDNRLGVLLFTLTHTDTACITLMPAGSTKLQVSPAPHAWQQHGI